MEFVSDFFFKFKGANLHFSLSYVNTFSAWLEIHIEIAALDIHRYLSSLRRAATATMDTSAALNEESCSAKSLFITHC